LALEARRPEEAAALLGASEHLTELYGVKAPLGLRELVGISDPHGRVIAMLGEERYREAFDKGRQMTIEQTVALIIRLVEETWGASQVAADRSA
jgi:hypothetical protein